MVRTQVSNSFPAVLVAACSEVPQEEFPVAAQVLLLAVVLPAAVQLVAVLLPAAASPAACLELEQALEPVRQSPARLGSSAAAGSFPNPYRDRACSPRLCWASVKYAA